MPRAFSSFCVIFFIPTFSSLSLAFSCVLFLIFSRFYFPSVRFRSFPGVYFALIRKGLVFCALPLLDPWYLGVGIASFIEFPLFLTTCIIPSFFADFFVIHRLRKDHLPLSLDRRPPTVVHASIPPPTIPIPYHVIDSLLSDAPILKPPPQPTKTYTNSSPTHSTLIGIISPELFDAFPRRHPGPGMTLWDAVVTGSEGGFVRLNGSERVRRYV